MPPFALHAHLPKLAFQVLDVRFTHSAETMCLDELRDAQKTLPYVLGQGVELFDHPTVENLDVPGHDREYISKLRCVEGSGFG
jgi:hypothetical protein